jgi:hypothetical protein
VLYLGSHELIKHLKNSTSLVDKTLVEMTGDAKMLRYCLRYMHFVRSAGGDNWQKGGVIIPCTLCFQRCLVSESDL